jgi:hypothetical protein
MGPKHPMIRSYKYFTHTGTYVFSLTNIKISFKILIGGKVLYDVAFI